MTETPQEIADRLVANAGPATEADLRAQRESFVRAGIAFGSDRDEAEYRHAASRRSDRQGAWILTFTGKRFFPLDPRPEDVDFRDICHALSLETRYGGHCAYHYSVAQHTVLLHDCIVANGGFRKGVARYCLIHDASEAYLKDIPRPLKASLPGYIEVERQLCNMLESMFMVKLYDFEKSDFKELDTRICRDEMQALFAPELLPNWNVKSLGLTITPWSPEQAEQALLKLFKHYWPGLL